MTDFGRDLSCVDDLDEAMVESTGIAVLAEACLRRLITPHGSLPGETEEERDYGFDLRSLLHKAQTAIERAETPGRIRQELLKEEGVAAVDVIVTKFELLALAVDIRVTADDGPFRLVIDVGAAGLLIATAEIGGVLLTLANEAATDPAAGAA